MKNLYRGFTKNAMHKGHGVTYLISVSSFMLLNSSWTCSTKYICCVHNHVIFTKFTFRFWIEYLQVFERSSSNENSCITRCGTSFWFNGVDWDLEAWSSILLIYLLLFNFIIGFWGRWLHSQIGIVLSLRFNIIITSCMSLICTLRARGFLSLNQAWTRDTQQT